MSGKPAARLTDPTSCPLPGHGTNPIAKGSPNVLFDNLPAARLTDTSACGSPIVGAVVSTVLINGLPAATLGSTGGHGSVVVGGSGSVIIGNSAVAAPFTAPTPLSIAAVAAPAAAAKAAENQPPATAPAAQPAQQAAATTAAASAIAQPVQTTDRVAAAKEIVDTFECSASQSRAFNDRDHPMGTASDPFEKSKVIEQLRVRVARSQGQHVSTKERITPFPNQQETSLCGPAVFFYALLVDRPDLYTQAIIDLWETGETTIGQLHIKPSHDCRNPKKFSHTAAGDRISAIDWISLASLRDSENDLFDYDSPGDQIPGITLPGKVKAWFTRAGATVVFDNIQFLGHINQEELVELLSYAGGQHHVTSLISASMVEGGAGVGKNHWIAWEKPPHTQGGRVDQTTLPVEVIVDSKLFSWGQSMHQVTRGYTLKKLLKDLFGGIVFSRIP
jgi:uncharacterized Zn-binding protein involved in type VI secretion